ncbi:hypothetical protein WN865_01190 [Tetragenococcus halophilus]
MFQRVADKMHVLGFVVMSAGLYQLYILDLSSSSSLVVEGSFNKKRNCFLYDFYSLRFDKRKNQVFGMKVYCDSVTVKQMYNRVSHHMNFMRSMAKENEVKLRG